MTKLILSGCNGYMGRVVTAAVKDDPAISIIAGIDVNTEQLADYPVFVSPDELTSSSSLTNSSNLTKSNALAGDVNAPAFNADVLVDFSSPSALDGLLAFGLSNNVPLVLCATGYTPDQISALEKASERIPVFRSGNMSVGINLLADLIKRASAVLGGDFDIEIVERHHRRKVDAPSGTAIMLADAASSALPDRPEYIFERESRRSPRRANEIGISAVRGGTIVGVHDVIFAGQDEVLEFRHTAASRDVFAVGAIRAAKFIAGKAPGLYNMGDVLT